MKHEPLAMLAVGFLAFLFIASVSTCKNAQQSIVLQTRLNTPTISMNGGIAYLQVTVTTPPDGLPRRRPLNISVVLDRSGSMGDEAKMDYAKQALRTLVDQLRSDDILSIVIYDDVIDVLRPSCPVGRDKYSIKHLIDEIYPRGSTNLGGGMVEGFRQVEENMDKEYVNRVVLLSDGLANQGITDPRALEHLARKYRSQCISLTTMGVGLDYNENLMVELAKNGGGNYYFIESPNSLASIMSREFNTLSTVIAQDASIEITLGYGVALRDVIGSEYRVQGDRYVVPIGDLYSNDCRQFTVELTIPEGVGALAVAASVLRYESNQYWGDGFPTSSANVRYTSDVALIEKERDLGVQAKADIAVSTRTVEHAMNALDQGKNDEASAFLQRAQDVLRASPAASSAGAGGAQVRDQAVKLESYQRLLKDSTDDARKAKKSIQYENYKTQKKQ